MIIVFTLIGILVGLGLPQYQTAARRAREAVLKEDLFQFRKLIDQYLPGQGEVPGVTPDPRRRKIPPVHPRGPDDTNSRDHLGRSPRNPVSGRATPPENLGIVDVKSGSEAKALDGTPYNTW